MLIVEGWENPSPDGMFNLDTVKNKDGVTIKASRYSCFDDRYKTDFDKVINQYKHKFIADYRERIAQHV